MKIGKILYTEFFKPLGDYYSILKIKYCIYELVIPAVIGVGCAFVYSYYNKVENALDKLCDILPDTIAILIGFSTLLITLLLTGNENAIERLKKHKTEIELNRCKVSLYQCLHIQFTHSIFTEILLILLIFFYLFLKVFSLPDIVHTLFLGLFIILTLNIFLSLLRGITNLYFSYFNEPDNTGSNDN